MDFERRSHQRFKGEIYFTFRYSSFFSKKESPMILISDISQGGLSFIYPEAFSFGKGLLLRLYLPMYRKPVRVKAEVRKSQRLPDGQYKTGLKFIKISSPVQKSLELRTFLAHQTKAKEY
jgi:c-di-GMP-binding flagellar brake protein YcgR